MATGRVCCLLDHDDELTPECTLGGNELVERSPSRFVVFRRSKLTTDGVRAEPFFKPQLEPGSFCYR